MGIGAWLVALAALGVPQEEPRTVLCLYDSTEERTPQISEIHLYAETVLNYLGLLTEYRDVNDPLPEDAEMAGVRGVLTWFMDNRMRDPAAYWAWIRRQAEAGRRIVILNNLGATYDVPLETINRGLAPLGLRYFGNEIENPALLEIVEKHPIVEFERPIDRELRWYMQIKADPSHTIHLRVRRTDLQDGESHFTSIGPLGGLSIPAIHYDSYVDRDHWRLDPFAFLSAAFAVDDFAAPDLTTAMGRRIFFSSIDGDGVANGVRGGPRAGRLAGEVVRDEFLRRYDLPFTVSVIAADLDHHEALARSLLSLPNVEVGAHGWYHPISWSRGTLAYPGVFSLEKEVRGAVRRINEISPGKPVKIYLWTGDCMPPPEAIRMCDEMGIANINGSDPGRYMNYDSLANLRSPTVWAGGELQFNARSMSENHFTDLWTRNFHAYRNALRTYQRTEAPRRILPIHVYFHFYVVEQPAGEMALREILEWVRRQDVFPMTASEYVRWVRDFHQVRVFREAPGRWRVRDYGACRTIRFEHATQGVDLARSRNVLGFRREKNRLYVHLGEGGDARIVLGDASPQRPYIIDANGYPENGRLRSHSAARARLWTPRGVEERRSEERVLDLPEVR